MSNLAYMRPDNVPLWGMGCVQIFSKHRARWTQHIILRLGSVFVAEEDWHGSIGSQLMFGADLTWLAHWSVRLHVSASGARCIAMEVSLHQRAFSILPPLSCFSVCRSVRFRFRLHFSSLQSLPELPLLLQHLQLQSLDTIAQSLLALPNCSRAELLFCSQLTTPGSLLLRLSTVVVVIIIWAG